MQHQHIRNFYAPILLLVVGLSFVLCEPTAYMDSASNADNRLNTLFSDLDRDRDTDQSNLDKRVERYAFGLGRRAYTYTNGGNGMKRLPVYNFGLGKRARPYSFGLGKRADYEDLLYDNDYDLRNNMAVMDEKRNRPYSFGLGKRDAFGDVDRRGPQSGRYGFGLGRR